MADGYWRYADPRQQAVVAPPPASLKRTRPDYGGAPEILGYYPREEDRTIHHISSYVGAEPGRPVGGGTSGRPIDGPHIPDLGGMDGRAVGYSTGRTEPPLPPDASNTLFVDGLPANCTLREVSHIFRPFVGFQEVRLVNKESKHPGGDPLVLCFVDFATPSQAAFALDALKGYKFDEHDRESVCLRLQFARYPGPRSFGRPRSRR